MTLTRGTRDAQPHPTLGRMTSRDYIRTVPCVKNQRLRLGAQPNFSTMLRTLSALYTLAPWTCLATVHTVSNNPGIPAQFGDITTAISASQAGDTLYLHASPNTYSGGVIYFSIPLTFIGAGYNSPYASGLRTWVGQMSPQIGSSNSTYLGLSFNSGGGIFNQDGTGPFGRVDQCVFLGNANLIAGNGSFISRSHFDTDSDPYIGTESMFLNNVVVARSLGAGWTGLNINGDGSTVVKNNIFISADDEFAIGTCSDATIIDNIFYGARAIDPAQTLNCTISNNLTFGSSENTLPLGSNSGANNIIGQDPLFIQVPTYDLNFQYDYGLQAASPAIAAGTDGLDLGIYGGSYPISPGLVGQPLPYIAEFIVSNPVIEQGGNLNVTLKAKKRP